MSPKNIFVVGVAAAGKSQMIKRYIRSEFSHDYNRTIATDFYTKTVPHCISDEKKISVKLNIWDCAQIKGLSNNNTHCALLVFDPTDKNAKNSMNDCYQEIKKVLHESTPIILVKTKSDLEIDFLDNETISEFMRDKPDIKDCMQVSAKNGQGISELFGYVINLVIDLEVDLVSEPPKIPPFLLPESLKSTATTLNHSFMMKLLTHPATPYIAALLLVTSVALAATASMGTVPVIVGCLTGAISLGLFAGRAGYR